MRRRIMPGAVLVAALTVPVAAPAAAVEPPPPGWQGPVCGTRTVIPLSVARDVDDSGLVVGHDQRSRAASWDSRTGTYRWYGGIDGGLSSEISAISGGGRVAGAAQVDGPTLDPAKAVRVEGPLPLRPVDRSLRTSDQVQDVNDANVVVGTSEIVGGQGATEAFVWTDRRHVLATPDPSYVLVHALSVNEAGWVLGSGYRLDARGVYHYQVLVWRPDRTVTVLPPLPDGGMFVAEHIDEQGGVIGHHLSPDWTNDALVTWSPTSGYTFVPSPGGDLQVIAADDRGGAVGTVIDPTTGSALPFLYRPDTGFRRLAEPGGALLRGVPYGMSEAGQVLLMTDQRPHLWTPTCPAG
ncbi:hypothetical protein [Cellulomonas fimi]|uniref:Uncharacterized protein n=1 Tax=Cellulomonas fimi (strain ATCC 484 / DSM 20113 / JCM 1341 / CCUG 24087 / LMG 16345 / NBRC 15513 / NCIMB 8980 / NCTC 7547 / NRS-133) TaxID=590998 RepID=F4GZH9_CELFA|nr:hypothetical protein [Cellulomonas fimi]AEE44900.1 hypothetical protein Celf_0760 [Cellulomonas fimi ATCC 484]NNH08272.1 hypothetical protein [Cellulomonas fimi]VEH27622.1 Uncharacterised protein [Cellulomonas fimi]